MSATAYYRVGQYYVDDTDPTIPVLYRCMTDGDKTSSVWALVSGGGGVQQFKIVSDGGDWWVCHTWDGVTEGSTGILVMKPHELRCGTLAITSETIDGVTYTYTYTAVVVGGVTVSYTRDNTGSDGSHEVNEVDPYPLAGKIIYAAACTNMIPPGYGTTVLLIDLNNSSRAWTK